MSKRGRKRKDRRKKSANHGEPLCAAYLCARKLAVVCTLLSAILALTTTLRHGRPP